MAANKDQVKAYRERQIRELKEKIAKGEADKKELSHLKSTNRRHGLYDFVKSAVRLTQKKNPYTVENNTFEREGKTYTNKGSIMLGGTKPMFEYKDEKGNSWLMKEAITAIGTKKPMGALVSEAAFKLQNIMDPESAIPTFAQKSADGKTVYGSFQARVNVNKDALDLFQWQRDDAGKLPKELPKELSGQILREHVTDWLLCNFDTKGENFITDTDGKLRGIDKEQSFRFLFNKAAQHMSYDYSPNPNQTLYDTVFQKYAAGEMDIDLQETAQYVKKIKDMDKEQYMSMFEDVITAKCKGNKGKETSMYNAILDRKEHLEEEYQNFYGKLVKERYKDKAKDFLDEKGGFRFEYERVNQTQNKMDRERSMDTPSENTKTRSMEINAGENKKETQVEQLRRRLEERQKLFMDSRKQVSPQYEKIQSTLEKLSQLAQEPVTKESRDMLEEASNSLKEQCTEFLASRESSRWSIRGRARRNLVNEVLKLETQDEKTLKVLKDDKMLEHMQKEGKSWWQTLAMGRNHENRQMESQPVVMGRMSAILDTKDYGAMQKLFASEETEVKKIDRIDENLAHSIDVLTKQSLAMTFGDVMDKKQIHSLWNRVEVIQKQLPSMEKVSSEKALEAPQKEAPQKEAPKKAAPQILSHNEKVPAKSR